MMFSNREEKLKLAKDRIEEVENLALRENLESVVKGMAIIIGSMETEEFFICIHKCEEKGNCAPLKQEIRRIIFPDYSSKQTEKDKECHELY